MEESELPKKYIRTFASDQRTMKEGGTPDLAPFEKPQPVAAERLVTASPIITAPTPVETSTPTEVEAPLPVVPAELASPKPAPLKTYSGDFSERMQETRASTLTVLASEQDRAPVVAPVAPPEEPNRKNRWYIIGGASLLIIGGIGMYFAYSRYLSSVTPVNIVPTAATPIFVDARKEISGTDTALLRAVGQAVSEPLGANSVLLLELAGTQPAGTTVFSALNLRAPGILARNIEASGSMAGVVNTAGGQSPFFILSVGAYGSSFSGMLSWEPVMVGSFSGLFPPYKTSGAATTTTAATSTPSRQPAFRDEVVSNHDVRVYRDASGRSVVLYGFWNQNTLVIARDPAAFTEILGRLATSHSAR